MNKDGAEVKVEGTEAATAEKPKGRAGVLAKFLKENPDYEGDPSDDELWGYAGEDYDNLKGAHSKVMEGQKGLYDYVSKDPRFGAAIGMSFGEGEDKIPLMQAIGRLYGKDAFDDSEEFMKGVEEFNERYNNTAAEQQKAQDNFANLTVPRLDQFAKDNNLTDEQMGEIGSGLMVMAEGMMMGDIPVEAIDLIYKGMNYDKDVQEAADTGYVEGQGEKIRADMKKKTGTPAIPDLAGGTGAGKRNVTPKKEKGSYYDDMKPVN